MGQVANRGQDRLNGRSAENWQETVNKWTCKSLKETQRSGSGIFYRRKINVLVLLDKQCHGDTACVLMQNYALIQNRI